MKDLQDFRQSLTIGIEVYSKDRDLAKKHNVYLMESIFGACHDELVRTLEKFDKATKRRWAGRAAGAGVGRCAPPTEAKENGPDKRVGRSAEESSPDKSGDCTSESEGAGGVCPVCLGKRVLYAMRCGVRWEMDCTRCEALLRGGRSF